MANELSRIGEIGVAASLMEEVSIIAELSLLAPRIAALPGRRNTNSPGHRVRGICYRLWAESLQETLSYIRNLNR